MRKCVLLGMVMYRRQTNGNDNGLKANTVKSKSIQHLFFVSYRDSFATEKKNKSYVNWFNNGTLLALHSFSGKKATKAKHETVHWYEHKRRLRIETSLNWNNVAKTILLCLLKNESLCKLCNSSIEELLDRRFVCLFIYRRNIPLHVASTATLSSIVLILLFSSIAQRWNNSQRSTVLCSVSRCRSPCWGRFKGLLVLAVREIEKNLKNQKTKKNTKAK